MKWLRICLVLAFAAAPGLHAQDYPNKPIRLIVPFAPGGGNDQVARAIAQDLASTLGQAVLVDNRAGAGGVVGAELAAKAAPDGYTLFLGGVGSLAVNPHVVPNISYDPLKDFVPIVLLASAPSVIVANPDVPFKTLPEMTAYAKAHPGALSYASNGNGSSAHISTLLYESLAGVDMLHVPYKGLAPALTDLLSGRVQIMFSSIVAIMPQIKAGKLRALAVTGSRRSFLLPDVPTVAQSGIAAYEAGSWYGLLAPRGTPEEVIRKVNQAANKALQQGRIKESLSTEGADVDGGSPSDFSNHIRLEYQRMGKLLSGRQITVN